MLIEICANSYQSAINAEEAGADRIELCSELAVGGITPSYGLIKKVMQDISIPVHVLIRPRSGDFTYSDDEFEIMKEDIKYCKEVGCAGIVSGILHSDNTIDINRTEQLKEISKPLSFTFHRGFDWVQNPKESLKQLEQIGVNRILTSGQEPSAEYGISLLKELRELSNVKILPGGGINIDNIQLFQKAGFDEVHLSATKHTQTIETPKISMNSLKHFEETKVAQSDQHLIHSIINLLNKHS